MEKLEARFWAKIDKRGPDECWEWVGAVNKNCGYGVFQLQTKTTVYAHRVAAFLYGLVTNIKAPVNKKAAAFVLHTCDNRKCCNPRHLYIGTLQQNTRDMRKRRRAYVPRGEEHPNAKLTNTQVVVIRQRYAKGVLQTALAKEYNVSFATISDIVKGKSYAQL